jgi:hypothetical protein
MESLAIIGHTPIRPCIALHPSSGHFINFMVSSFIIGIKVEKSPGMGVLLPIFRD